MTAILLCPGALDGDDDRPAPLGPAARGLLDGALARARVLPATPIPPGDVAELAHESWLRDAFALPREAAVGAYAAWAAGAPAEDPNDWIVRPVHLHLALDHVRLAPPAALALAADEEAALLATANRHLDSDGVALARAAGGCWRLRCREPLHLRPRSSALASRGNVFEFQPQGQDARRWRALLGEIQLLWHEHPANQAREARGERAVNGIWIEGRAPALAAPVRFGAVSACSAELAGLARAAGITPSASVTMQALDAALAAPATHLIECPLWQQSHLEWDPAATERGWSALDQLLAPALRAAPRGAHLEVVLTGREQVVTLAWHARDRWKFWRRIDTAQLGACAPARS